MTTEELEKLVNRLIDEMGYVLAAMEGIEAQQVRDFGAADFKTVTEPINDGWAAITKIENEIDDSLPY